MRNFGVSLAALPLLALGSATPERQFYKWNAPRDLVSGAGLSRRQTPPPGYHPEFGTCGSGTTCENACGPEWALCPASTDLSLFCYNPSAGQTCCGNGSGRACEAGYYCAWQTFGGKVWCCEEGQSLEECGVPADATTVVSVSSVTTTETTTTTVVGDPATPSGPSGPSSGPVTSTKGTPGGGDDSGSTCPAVTVTATVTSVSVSTVSVAAITVTETVYADICSGVDTTTPGVPGSFTPTPPPTTPFPTAGRPSNGTLSSTLFTAGAANVFPGVMNLAVGIAGLLFQWL